MRRLLVGTCAVTALAVPATALAWEIGGDPTVVYTGLTVVDIHPTIRTLQTQYGSGGSQRCSYWVVFEYKPLAGALRYEYTWTSPTGRSTSYITPRNTTDDGAAGGPWVDQGIASYAPSSGMRFIGSPSIGYLTRGDIGGACPANAAAGYDAVRMVAYVDETVMPTTPATPTPGPKAPGGSGGSTTVTPTPIPAETLELLPPATEPLASIGTLEGIDGTTAVVTVVRDGKTYRVDATSTLQLDDVIKVGSKTKLTLNYTTAGTADVQPGSEVRLAGDRKLELRSGQTNVAPGSKPLEVQTSGGTMGVQ